MQWELANDTESEKFPALLTNCLTLTRENPVVQTQFGGTVMGESAMVNTSDVGSLAEFTFNVSHLHCQTFTIVHYINEIHIFNQISPPSWFIALASWTFSRFKVKAVSVLLSSFILCLGFLATFSDSIRWPWGEIHSETWAHWLWSLSGPTRSPTASGSSTWRILWWNQESPRVNADLQEKWSTCWTSL